MPDISDGFFGVVVIVAAVGLSTVGVSHLVEDFRLFKTIERQCMTQGYIQNETTRIKCSVEGKNNAP